MQKANVDLASVPCSIWYCNQLWWNVWTTRIFPPIFKFKSKKLVFEKCPLIRGFTSILVSTIEIVLCKLKKGGGLRWLASLNEGLSFICFQDMHHFIKGFKKCWPLKKNLKNTERYDLKTLVIKQKWYSYQDSRNIWMKEEANNNFKTSRLKQMISWQWDINFLHSLCAN